MLIFIILFPLIGAAINGIVFATPLRNILFDSSVGRWEKKAVGFIGCTSVLLSAIFTTILFFKLLALEPGSRLFVQQLYTWIPSGELNVKV